MTKKIMFFTAPWCAGCKTLKPFTEKVKEQVEVEYIDVEQQPGAAEEYGITNLPTLFFVRDGELVQHKTGASESMIKEIQRFAES